MGGCITADPRTGSAAVSAQRRAPPSAVTPRKVRAGVPAAVTRGRCGPRWVGQTEQPVRALPLRCPGPVPCLGRERRELLGLTTRPSPRGGGAVASLGPRLPLGVKEVTSQACRSTSTTGLGGSCARSSEKTALNMAALQHRGVSTPGHTRVTWEAVRNSGVQATRRGQQSGRGAYRR